MFLLPSLDRVKADYMHTCTKRNTFSNEMKIGIHLEALKIKKKISRPGKVPEKQNWKMLILTFN